MTVIIQDRGPVPLYGKSSYQSMQLAIQTFSADIADIHLFYVLSFSPTRLRRIKEHIQRTHALIASDFDFDQLEQDERVDYLVFQSHLARLSSQNELQNARFDGAKKQGLFMDWVHLCIDFIETRHAVGRQTGRQVATAFQDALEQIRNVTSKLNSDSVTRKHEDTSLFEWVMDKTNELKMALEEAVSFYRGYDPILSWWVEEPWEALETELTALIKALGMHLGDGGAGTAGDITGQPIGRERLLAELKAEWIAYTPEELVNIGEREFEWCEEQMKLAASALGYLDIKEALEHVRETFVEPGQQIYMVRDLAREAIWYLERHDLVTVPRIAKECWQTTMMTPERQKINPFFLGGERIVVSYPTNTMCHEDKLMSMRGNNPPFSRSTVHHELIPGHHLHFYYMDRFRTYRKLFETPFMVEGWALYWEFLLWERGFPAEIYQEWAKNEAENRIGMLFWRMHRCARIIFSLKFHLNRMTLDQCIDLLVDRVGHERATAEGEVRRSFAGEYPPLYQAGYMLGALQLWSLRKEIVEDPQGPCWKEKDFHDAIMKECMLPVELLRASFKGEKLSVERKPQWKFYG